MPKKKQKRINKKTGKVDPGKGKVRPHHKEIAKRVNKHVVIDEHGNTKKISRDTHKKRLEDENNNYIPRTANKYQTEPKKLDETSDTVTYQWFEDNGHKDHLQLKRKTVMKEYERRAGTFSTITNKNYQNNYQEIFGDKKRGVDCEGGYKKFKKTYK